MNSSVVLPAELEQNIKFLEDYLAGATSGGTYQNFPKRIAYPSFWEDEDAKPTILALIVAPVIGGALDAMTKLSTPFFLWVGILFGVVPAVIVGLGHFGRSSDLHSLQKRLDHFHRLLEQAKRKEERPARRSGCALSTPLLYRGSQRARINGAS